LSAVKGIILSGSPFSVNDDKTLTINLDLILNKFPLLGICFGAQYLAKHLGGQVEKVEKREYGKAYLKIEAASAAIFDGIADESQVWMSHGDTIMEMPDGLEVIGRSNNGKIAGFHATDSEKPIIGLQFHPEVTHTINGIDYYRNFVINICGCETDWNPDSFIEATVADIKAKVGSDKVIMGISGGVDSSVAATLIHKAIGSQLQGIFVDNGLLRKNEFQQVLDDYDKVGLNVRGVNASDEFYAALSGISDPEAKRKAIGKTFIDVFDRAATGVEDAKWLGQGTIYPDVIESVSVHGPSAKIKSHHNVGGLPEDMKLSIVEPLRKLFKDEVREVGKALGLPAGLLGRHPFPGPGLAIRILGDVTPDKVKTLQQADHIFIETLKSSNWYDKVWQAGVILLPVQSVGVMGDERTYENVVALRAVSSIDGMTADYSELPYDLLGTVSSRIINEVKGINRVVYDISTKPPATIEWE